MDNEKVVASGWRDPLLSETGLEQAAGLGYRRAGDGIAAVFCSDLQRATQTARIAFQIADIPIHIDPRLRQCNYGLLAGMPVEEFAARRVQHIDTPNPGGESWREAIARVQGFVSELPDSYSPRTSLGHIATRWAFRHYLEEVPIEKLATERFTWRPGWEYIVR